MSHPYDEFYYQRYCGDEPYQFEGKWSELFTNIASRIVETIQPDFVLDAGCALGFLVKTLRDLGVKAFGMDISEYAIYNAVPDIRRFCRIASIDEPLDDQYDLIVCIEVLEHLGAFEAERAIGNLCQHTSDILFSSTPSDYKEVTHLNVRPPEYWAKMFARQGFFRDLDYDASFISEWAVRFRRSAQRVDDIVAGYERQVWHVQRENQARRLITIEQRADLAKQHQTVTDLRRRLTEKQAGGATLRSEVGEVGTADLGSLPATTSIEGVAKCAYSADLEHLSLSNHVDMRSGSQLPRPDAGAAIQQVIYLRERLASAESHLESLYGQLAERCAAIATLETAEAKANRAKEEVSRRLELITSSRGYLLLQTLWRIRWRVVPENSLRYSLYSHISRLLSIVFSRSKPHASSVRNTQHRRLPTALSNGNRVYPDRLGSPRQRLTEYETWCQRCAEVRYQPERAAERVKRLKGAPLISIIMPVFNTPVEYLRKAIDSVCSQYYPSWELCICDDASTAPDVWAALQEYSARDCRIKVIARETNGGIAMASNNALSLASGTFIGLLDHDDELTPDALLEVAATLDDDDSDLIYSDEDKLDEEGRRCEPFFKPAWSPDLLLSCNYVCHFGVYRKSILDELGGFRAGFDGSQDYDLVLRFSERAAKIAHIPKILYHWRKSAASAAASTEAKPYAYEAATRALADTLLRRKIEGQIMEANTLGFYRVKRAIAPSAKVSIIIPTRDRLDMLYRCIDSIETRTDYSNYEIIIIDNGSKHPATLEYLRHSPHKVCRIDIPFNYSRLNNLAARKATGEYLVFLNDDVTVIEPEWMSSMLEHAQRLDVGAVGAKLLFPDGSIQHAGTVLGTGGVASHSHRGVDGDRQYGYFNCVNVIKNYSAVTAACVMLRATVFDEIGGFNEKQLSVSYNDVDLCLRLREAGYWIVYTPYARLHHHESASRSVGVDITEERYMLARWAKEIRDDPFYSPNLSLDNDRFEIDFSKPEACVCVCRTDPGQETVGPLSELTAVEQEFFCGEDNLCAVGVQLATYGQACRGLVRFRLCTSSDPPVALAVVESDATRVVDNEHFLFCFEPIGNSGGRMFAFSIEFEDVRHGGALTVWRSVTNDVFGPYSIDGVRKNGTLSFRAYVHRQFRAVR